MDLGDTTWTEIAAAEGDRSRPIVVVPIGSCEQHGPHLPLATDSIIAVALARALVDRRSDCVLAPTVGITASGEHQGFAGTLSIGTAAMTEVVVELARSADWASGVVFVNGHGGNLPALRRAADTFERETRRVLIWSPRIDDGDPHAGRTETSLMFAIDPRAVRRDRAIDGPVPTIDDLVAHGVRPLSETGVLGNATEATAAEGERLVRQLVEQLVEAVERW